jgi:poly(3-hydroxybutyrate) depolymerase
MPDLFQRELAGGAQLMGFVLDSDALQGNPMGDPTQRMHPLLTPSCGGDGLPLVVVLTGFTGFGLKVLSKTSLWEENLPERIARMMSDGLIPPAVYLWPSCETKLGGSQYMNSTATGNYETMLLEELIPAVESATGAGGTRRIVAGKSSGGYGALTLVMRNPGYFSAAACHSGARSVI